MRFLLLLMLPFSAWLLLPTLKEGSPDFSPEKVNLALRRTADELLRLSGDSTSRIPAVRQVVENTWQLRLDQPFSYDQLPAQLQASLDLYGIRQPYQVVVRRCADNLIDLGYHQFDFLEKSEVPCSGRDKPEGCHFIEITFAESSRQKPLWAGLTGGVLLMLGVSGGIWFFRRQKQSLATPASPVEVHEKDWVEFGNSRLDVAGQVLVCSGVHQNLTFREAKLLRLFALSPNQLLERDFILQQVWADEGVLVGRSVDVFVSRLRKKLAADSTVSIVAVHGVGYRMETTQP